MALSAAVGGLSALISALMVGGSCTAGVRSTLAPVRVSMASSSGQVSMSVAGTGDEVCLAAPFLPWSCLPWSHLPWSYRACPPLLCWMQAEDSLPIDLLAAMDAAAELQGDAALDVDGLDVAALRQSLADLTSLGSGQQSLGVAREAKADAQRWKQAFGSEAAWPE